MCFFCQFLPQDICDKSHRYTIGQHYTTTYMEEKIILLISQGDDCKTNKNYDIALNCYNNALKLAKDDNENNVFIPKIELNIAETYQLKYSQTNDEIFLKLAKEHFSKIYKFIPLDNNLNTKLIHLALALNLLDKTIEKYKILGDENKEYKEFIHLSNVLCNLYIDTTNITNNYKQKFVIKLMFDFLLLPISVLLIILSLFSVLFKDFLPSGVQLLLLYFIYRAIIFYLPS